MPDRARRGERRPRRVRAGARARGPCIASAALDLAALRKGGYAIERAIADAPLGWARDPRGRVFQVTFDLRKRLWIGAAWAPRHDGDGELGRVALDVGGLELFVRRGGTGHHLRLVTGTIEPAPLNVRLTALTYALHRRWDRPLIRLTTFLGRPRRSDGDLNAGAWVEVGGLEMRSVGERTDALVRILAGHVALDLWQAPDLSSWLRVRGGVGLERTVPELGEGVSRVAPGVALELDAILDDAGLYRATAEVGWQRALATSDGPASIDRLRAEAAIEAVVLAINDQPISVRAALSATRRDDDAAAGWDLAALVGLRVSFWAPAR